MFPSRLTRYNKASLGDRLRIPTLLEENGSMPLSTCLEAVRNGHDAIAVITALALQRLIETDLDEARIGPEQSVPLPSLISLQLVTRRSHS